MKMGLLKKIKYLNGQRNLKYFNWRYLNLATELIFRYQPVATDLRYIESCMEIAYGFSRFGRYAYDIIELLETIGSIHKCDKSLVMETSNVASEMIRLSINALQTKEKNTVSRLYKMDDSVDALYTNYLKDLITLKTDSNDHLLFDPTMCNLCIIDNAVSRKNHKPCMLYWRFCLFHISLENLVQENKYFCSQQHQSILS